MKIVRAQFSFEGPAIIVKEEKYSENTEIFVETGTKDSKSGLSNLDDGFLVVYFEEESNMQILDVVRLKEYIKNMIKSFGLKSELDPSSGKMGYTINLKEAKKWGSK